jgi:hypothetical protein
VSEPLIPVNSRAAYLLLELDRLSIEKGRCTICMSNTGEVDYPAQLLVTMFVPECKHRIGDGQRQAAMCTTHYRQIADDVRDGTFRCSICGLVPTLAEPIELASYYRSQGRQ